MNTDHPAAATASRAPARKAPTKRSAAAAPAPAAKAVARRAATEPTAQPAKPTTAPKPAKAAKTSKPEKADKADKIHKTDKGDKGPKARAALVRDSFTMPEEDFKRIATLKARALQAQRPAKKSELLRAGLHVLEGLTAAALVQVLNKLVSLKPGRPKKAH